ncbi:hypothetical protein AWH56_019165 [Anaerobacillus isosaccharinicus]|uniref:Uncharacterized protein n=1 Tax=Anaerobacillus isosaccharinicus TaxID=1532552 RepID=A0A7S7RAF2_9BACI|nr:hypothetical protein [Anaerobacillus isosaccharinicus]MBA5586975.1 hypothetical protein [Anaerobacillus isosaccharinicus]QOY34821.1 hypothetical protein AWH56_019165 [Anaerobacillus isosaccharinicus]
MGAELLRVFDKKLQHKYTVTLKKNRLIASSKALKTYCSIQVSPDEIPPLELANTYFRWLTKASKKIIKINNTSDQYQLSFFFLKKPLLVLKLQEHDDQKVQYRVAGGLLAKTEQEGTFTFFRCNGNSVIALEHFHPRLPWLLYLATQAPIHELVMIKFMNRK